MTKNIFAPNKIIAEIVGGFRNKIAEIEINYQLPSGYLRTVLALHLPRFSKEELYLGKKQANRQLLNVECKCLAAWLRTKIDVLPLDLKVLALNNERRSKIIRTTTGLNEVYSDGKEKKIRFSEVKPEIGALIQKKLHYIGCEREDTLFHFGLFREESNLPFAYIAFSKLNRKYLKNALPFKANMENLLVLTRVFNVNSAPKNSISSLLGWSIRYFRKNYRKLNFSTILTAVNPNVLFKGTVFKGSGFSPFATAPFEPLYFKKRYVTRKFCRELFGTEEKEKLLLKPNLASLKISCLPLVWMGCGILPKLSGIFREHKTVKMISNKEYWHG